MYFILNRNSKEYIILKVDLQQNSHYSYLVSKGSYVLLKNVLLFCVVGTKYL